VLLTLGLAVVGLLGIWFSLPVWFPWVLPRLAARANARFTGYQREGYRRFSLHGFTYTNQSIRLEADRVEALTPTAWLTRLATRGGKTGKPFLSITGWRLESLPSTKPASPVYAQAQELATAFHFLQRWVPQVALSNGTVRVDQQSVQIPALTWSSGRLWARIEREKLGAVVAADVRHAPTCQLQLASEALHLESSMQVSTNADGLTLQSTNRWRNNPFELEAQLGHTASLPDRASLRAPNFQLPARLLQLPGYGDIQGSARAGWQEGRFDIELNAGAHPLAARTNLPPLTLDLHARGNTNHAVMTSAVLSSPWLRAALSRELAIHYSGRLLREPASLKLTADLSRQPWLPLEGRLTGAARFSPGADRWPTATFQLSGAGIGTPQLKAKSFSVEGGLDWPKLTISNAEAAFADGSTASVSGRVALNQSRMESGKLAFSGPLLRRWLPAGYSYQGLTVAGEFHGAFTNLSHRGHLAITNLTIPGLNPLGLALDWEGRQNRLNEAAAQISARGSLLQVEGAVGVGNDGAELQMKALTLQQSGKPVLSLAGPARIAFRRSHWTIDSFHWAGTGGELKAQGSLNWPRSGSFEVSAQGLQSDLAQDFLTVGGPAIELNAMNLSAGWSNGPVKFGLEVSAAEHTNGSPQVAATSAPGWESGLQLGGKVKLAGNAQGLTVQELEVASRGSPCANVHGAIPLTLNPAAGRHQLQITPEGPLNLSGDFRVRGLLPEKLTAWTGVRWSDPHLRLQVSGTPKEPQGRLQVQVRQIQLAQSNQPMPALTDLHLDLHLDRQQARLVDCGLLIQGQPMTLSAEVPLGADFWSTRTPPRLPDWAKASAHLRMPQTKLSAFAELYPELFSPQGELEINVSLQPGFDLGGYLKLQGARTRSLPAVGPLRDINVDLRCHERILELQSATANVGSASVQLSGRADLGDTDWFASISGAGAKSRTPGPKPRPSGLLDLSADELWPPFSFRLGGTNVSLVRQAEMIIRGDLDLTATRTNGAPPLLSGTVRLHDSFFLADLATLIPRSGGSLSQRPPYFSITNAFLADWRLAVKVTGDRFLKARTTVFNGEVSANLKLEGSLEQPTALGDIRIASGIVRFPFGSLQVQQGFVTLTSENPYHPQLSATASSTQFGYEINMQVSGTADAPVIQFSSNPPLSSEQILLLLTAGELPKGTFSLTPQQRAQTLAVFLGRDALSQLGFAEGTEERLTIHSGEQISQTGTPTYSVEFKLNDRFSLVGEYDRFGDYNAGVKWRIYSK